MYTFAKICCLCLNNKCSLINFKDCDLDKLKQIIPEWVSETNNKLPPWICLKCKKELDNTYIFYKKCRKSLYLLQSYNEKLQAADNNFNLFPSKNPYSLKIKISTKNNSFQMVIPDKEELIQANTILFDKNITSKSLLEKENNLESASIEQEISNVNRKTSNAENEETPDAPKEELFTEDTYLFDKIIAEKSSLEKENNLEFAPIKEETSDVNKKTSDAEKEETSDAVKEEPFTENTFSFNKDIAEKSSLGTENQLEFNPCKEVTSNADKDTSDADKDTSETVKEEFNLFEEDTLPFNENSSEINVSVIKNEINSNIFKENEEKHHFNIFRNKSSLESVVQDIIDSLTSIQTNSDSQVILEEKNTNNQNEKVINEGNKQSTESSNRRRRRTRPVYYNEESDNENRNFNDDSDFEPDLNKSDDNISDISTSTSDLSNHSAKKLKTNNSQQAKNNLGACRDSNSSLILRTLLKNSNSQETQVLSKNNQTTRYFYEVNKSRESKISAPGVVIHHLPNTSLNTNSLNSRSTIENILPQSGNILAQPTNILPQPTNILPQPTNILPPPINILPQPINILPLPENILPQPGTVINKTANVIQTSIQIEPTSSSSNFLPQVENGDTTTTTNIVEPTKSTKEVKTFRRKYVCNICRNKFKSSVELKEHVASHEITGYTCKTCFKLCLNNNDLELHMKEHNQPLRKSPIINYNPEFQGNDPFSSLFDSILQTPRTSILQTPTVINVIPNPVNKIPEVIEIDSDNDDDDDDDYFMEKFFCNICNKKFEDFPQHMIIHQNENKAICVYCDTTFLVKSQLFQHLKDVHCANDPICQICNKTFKNVDLLFIHMYSHYDTIVHECSKCEQLFLNAGLMYRHLEKDHDCAEFKCYKCDKTFESRKLIMDHYPHHESTDSTLCHVCGKGLKTKRALQKHFEKHMPLGTYSCKVCGKQCVNRKRLRDHMDSKHGDNIYQCEVCLKILNTKIAFKVHQNSHSEDKKRFVCKVCGKRFIMKFLLKNHERIHTGEKPFECKTCGKKFTQEVSLVVHNRIHTGEKPYTCADCGKSYTQSYVYKMHLKKFHSNNENQNKKCSKEKE